MKNMYSIGETAKLMGISVQTLRYYSKIQLVKPKYINPQTRYRYYTEEQFHYIDRIKYLQSLGFSLEEIDLILADGTVGTLLPHLERKKQKYLREMEKLNNTIHDIQWYINYFKYPKRDHFPEIPYKLTVDERYLVSVPYNEGETTSDCYIRLNEMKNSPPLNRLNYIRQYAYLLDFDRLIQKEFKPRYLGIFVKNPLPEHTDSIIRIPKGEFLCFRGRILTDEWDPSIMSQLYQDLPKPAMVLANEYEDNLVVNTRCIYEVQVMLPH